MIQSIISFSVKNKLVIGMATLALIAWGLYAMWHISLDAVPDITNNQVQVITISPTLATEEVEQFITYPVELAMANLPGVSELRSISRFGLSVVTVVFEEEQGPWLPRQLVAEQLADIKDEIPSGLGEPFMGPVSTGLGEIYQYTIEPQPGFEDRYSPLELRTIQDWQVQRQLMKIPGVVEVNSFGGAIKQFEVAVRPRQLLSMNITLRELFKALEDNNANTGASYIEKEREAYFIRGEGLLRSEEDIAKVPIKNIGGQAITVGDVAEVRIGSPPRYGIVTRNGKGECVGGTVMMLKGANSYRVVEDVKERIAEVQNSLPEGLRIVPFLDRSRLIERTTATVSENLALGGLIVILVLVLLLGSMRAGLIVASTIPLSLLFAFGMMHLTGVSANLMSLGAIDFGIIVDGAVIIVEYTVFQLTRRRRQQKEALSADERDTIAKSAAVSMMNSAFFGQLIIVIVYVPILALTGVEGKMFTPMALTVAYAIIGVMILCFTYVPMMAALTLGRGDGPGRFNVGDRIVAGLQRVYEPLLRLALRGRILVLGLALALLAFSLILFSRLGGEFVPDLEEGDIAFHIILKPGSSLLEMQRTSTRVEQLLMQNFPEIEQIVSRAGVSKLPTDPMPMEIADVFVILAEKEEWVSADSRFELVERFKKVLSVLPGVNYEFTQPIKMRFNELLTGVREDIAVKIFGDDHEILAAKANQAAGLIRTIPGVADLMVEATSGMPQVLVHYRRARLAQHGLSVAQVNLLLQTAFSGAQAGVIYEGERRFDLVLRLHDDYRHDIDEISRLMIPLSNGAHIPLREVADIDIRDGPMQISREDARRRISIGINIRGRDVESLIEEIRGRLDDGLTLPPGYYLRFGGAFENMQRAEQRLTIVVPAALAAIFLLLYLSLRSVKQTLLIYSAIPLAGIGGIAALSLRDMPFSISAGVGFVALCGVVVLNGLVLINKFNELQAEGIGDPLSRILQGTRSRLRPILLTASTDILGFLPMAFSHSAGAEVQRPLATVVIGGICTATVLTLFVLPILYGYFGSGKKEEAQAGTQTAVNRNQGRISSSN